MDLKQRKQHTNCILPYKIPYITHNSLKTLLLHIAPKLTARYIHDFYKAAQNMLIPTTPSMISTLYFTCLFYLFYFTYSYNVLITEFKRDLVILRRC